MADTHVHDFLDEEGRAQFARHLVELKEIGQNAVDVECVYRRKDGSPVELMVSESVLCDENGDVTAYAHRLTLDAERRALLHELSASQGLLDEAQAIARVGSWELDFATDTMTWSRQMYAILGADPDTLDPQRRRLPPADRGGGPGDGDRAVPGRPARTGSFTFDARLQRLDGPVVWVRGIGRVTYGADGTATRIGGTTQDISDIKEAELKLLDAVVLNSLMQVMASAANEAETLLDALLDHAGMLLADDDWLRGVGFTRRQRGAEPAARALAADSRGPGCPTTASGGWPSARWPPAARSSRRQERPETPVGGVRGVPAGPAAWSWW